MAREAESLVEKKIGDDPPTQEDVGSTMNPPREVNPDVVPYEMSLYQV